MTPVRPFHLDSGAAVGAARLTHEQGGVELEVIAGEVDGVHRARKHRLVGLAFPELEGLPRVVDDHLARTHAGRHLGYDLEGAHIVEDANAVAVANPARPGILRTQEDRGLTPLKPQEIVLGKVTPYVLLSFTNALTIIVLGFLVFDVPVVGSLWLLLLECMLYITLALSLGVLISTVARTQQIAMVMSLLGLMLPTILLSGFIFPIDNMPSILQWFSSIMPARWFIVIVKNIMLKGTGFTFIWKETLILLGMTLFFILAAVKRFNIRLE